MERLPEARDRTRSTHAASRSRRTDDPSSIARLRDKWIVEYNAWRTRRLDHRELVYAWADGIYVKAGLKKQKAALLVVTGAMSDGRKEILTIVPGYRESTESWTDVLRDLSRLRHSL